MNWRPPEFTSDRGNAVLALQLLVGFLLCLWLLWEAIGWGAGYLAHQVPDSWEKRAFKSLNITSSWKEVAYTDEEKRAQKVFDKILKNVRLRDLNYRLYFVEGEAPNAFAVPGGSIGLTQGLLKFVTSEKGLATVIGHELGHIHYRHSLERMGHSLILGGILMMTIGDYGFLTSTAMSLGVRKNSRDQETEADEYGVRAILRTYGNTHGAYEFFEKLAKDPKLRGSKFGEMLSTHPYTPDRLKHIKKYAWRLKKQKHQQK